MHNKKEGANCSVPRYVLEHYHVILFNWFSDWTEILLCSLNNVVKRRYTK